ncbi:MAG: glycosyltransferase [Bacteroidota bacterium]|nr:glycosyltransferase [Bacteroidota bacterium]
MNILFCSNYSIGCVPYYARRALMKLGHNVFAFSPDYDSDGWLRCKTEVDIHDLLGTVGAKVDLFLLVEASTGTKFFPKGLASVPVPTGWWAVDNHLNYRWHKEYANLFDIVFFAQKEYLIKAQRYGVQNLHWLPVACDEDIHLDRKIPRIYDVSFIGNLTPNRKKFFGRMGIPINLVSGAYLEEVGNIYSQSKIVLNISAREDLNMRVFEAMCAGALLVTQRVDAGMSDLFEENHHFVYHNIRDVQDVIRYYLVHESDLIRIAADGQKKVISEHTYTKRMEKLLSIMMDFENFESMRKKKYAGFRIYAQKSLVYRHRTFRLKEKADTALKESLKRSFILTLLYLFRFSIYRLTERIEKIFKKNF